MGTSFGCELFPVYSINSLKINPGDSKAILTCSSKGVANRPLYFQLFLQETRPWQFAIYYNM